MGLFIYQDAVFEALRQHEPVIVQAPTGSGKTRCGLYPFLRSKLEPEIIELPDQCIYSVPLQTLARQFYGEYGKIVQSFRQKYRLRSLKRLAFQTGAHPGDPRFEADLLFTTIDQTLSSFLSLPYGLSTALANFNAGAVLGSYLVLDEFHLFPVNKDGGGALMTTLHMLQQLKGLTPWTLMTATFSRTLLHGLCDLLGAVEISPDTVHFDDIPAQQGKQRVFTVRAEPLTASSVWDDMRDHHRQRVLVICNTVDRAREVTKELRRIVAPDVDVILFYNRFWQGDRTTIEQTLAREFGEETSRYRPKRVILVATQVVEVGLNITAEVLHTELAPAASIIQRAGRCARFAGQCGHVFLYDVPRDDRGAPNYAPYFDQREVCQLSWGQFQSYSGQTLDYTTELKIVDGAHSAFDKRFLERFATQKPEQLRLIKDAWTQCSRALGPSLIRDIDTITLLIHPAPSQKTLPDPYDYQGISLRRSTLRKAWSHLQELGADLEWILAIPREVLPIAREQQNAGQFQRATYSWEHRLKVGSDIADLEGVDLVVIHPEVARYDKDFGFHLDIGGDPLCTSPLDQARKKQKRERVEIYRYETYEQHIKNMLHVYQRDLHYQGAYVQRRLEQRLSLPQGTIDQALRFLFAIHDVGKLNEAWQRWAHAWQRAIHALTPHAILPPADAAIAHTDLNRRDPAQRQLQKTVTATVGARPNHAAESALVCLPLLRNIAGESEPLYQAMVTAVVRHHHALTQGAASTFQGYRATTQVQSAKVALQQALAAVFLDHLNAIPLLWKVQGTLLEDALIQPHDSTEGTLLYFFLVRALRRADQLALQEPSRGV
jgi:CRISPR-associated endonuclease/helicase Cas3